MFGLRLGRILVVATFAVIVLSNVDGTSHGTQVLLASLAVGLGVASWWALQKKEG